VNAITPDQARRSLRRIARERRALADRIRLPSWYLAAYVTAALALFGLPALVAADHRLAAWIVPVTILSASLVLGLLDTVVRRVSGTRVSTDDARAYPATRRPRLLLVGVVVCGSAATWVAAENAGWAISLACGLVSAALLVSARLRMLAAVRSEIGSSPPLAR
jgi:hypothetical protein